MARCKEGWVLVKTVTLGITTYGNARLLEDCLWSIKKSIVEAGYSNHEVVVVDDGTPIDCASGAIEVICDDYSARYVRCAEQKGNVARYNTVVEESKGDIICLLDNDVIIPDRWFTSLFHFLTANETIGVASYLSQKVTGEEVGKLFSQKHILAVGSGRCPERATELAGYAYAFTRENYELVGGFDENYKYFIGDSDFCCKLAEQGLMSYRLLYPIVYHREHATYDAYPELTAWSRVNEDLAVFKRKWGCTPKEAENKFLAQIKPQMISWYANYAVHYDLDVPMQGEFMKEPVKVTSYEEVPKEVKGKEE